MLSKILPVARLRACRFSQDSSGAVAILFAIALLPILMAAGGAIDYAASLRAKQSLDTMADSAALAAAELDALLDAEQRPLARRAPDLVPVLPNDISFTLDVWLAMHEDLKTSRPVRIVYDALAKGLADYIREG